MFPSILCRHTLKLLRNNLIVNELQVKETRSIKRWVAPTLRELNRRREKVGPEPAKPRSTHLEWNYEAEIFAFGKRLGENFNKNLLKQAMIQREYANLQQIKADESGISIPEKIENFKLIEEGEGIISQYIKEEYGKLYPLSNDIVNAVHDYLTNEKMLAHVAKHIGLTDLILTTEFPVETKTLSNTFKAVVAALKHSKDLKQAQLFVKDLLLSQMNGEDIYDIWNLQNPFEYLAKLLEKKGVEDIEPRLCNQSATNTILANYQVGLYTGKELIGIGWGETISIAKETAALNAIQRILGGNYVQK